MRKLEIRGSLKDLLAGAIFIAFGLFFAIGALQYNIGTPLRMGPGYMPLVLGGMMIALGAAIVVNGFLTGEPEPVGGIAVRPIVFIVTAFIFFGLTIRGLGVVPSLFVTTLIAALARERTSPQGALVIAIGLTLVSVVVFIELLHLRLQLWGPWLPF
ncbi:MAG TPA: tripartite tricarboxylate transporter TctB family protein [candidate division Zixibacteria bacterium]|nr:tripartite tricarboxylate transporter TctB family protein [candidate division Zixibacteria bacterium]